MNEIYNAREDFQKLLFNYRSDLGLTVRELAEKAAMSQSLISAFEQAEKQVSAEAALKLADALALKGTEREHFLILAAATMRKDRLLSYARELPAELLNFLPQKLSQANIDLDTIIKCQYNAGVRLDKADPDQLVLELRNGQKVVCSLSVVTS